MNVIDVSKVIDEERKTICFTGHRPNKLVGYTSRVPYTVFVRRLKEYSGLLLSKVIPVLLQEERRESISLHFGQLKD